MIDQIVGLTQKLAMVLEPHTQLHSMSEGMFVSVFTKLEAMLKDVVFSAARMEYHLPSTSCPMFSLIDLYFWFRGVYVDVFGVDKTTQA